MNNFASLIKNQINEDYNESYTENGAKGYKTTGKALLDLNFAVASLRNATDNKIIAMFDKAYAEDPALAITWLFYARDAREGLGERNLFRVCFRSLFETDKISVKGFSEDIKNFLTLVAEYGRWDDLYSLVGINDAIDQIIGSIFTTQLEADYKAMKANKSVSLLAKWLKSESASSADSKKLATWTTHAIGMSAKDYRKTLAALRKYIDVTEVKMCANDWEAIDYSKVPSKAGLNYKEAFKKHDEDRYTKFIDAAVKGEVKINSAVLFPHEIVSKYVTGQGWNYEVKTRVDNALEALWSQLPDLVNGDANTLVVADGSGSMTSKIGGSDKISALDVANALAIYFAERSSGEFKDKYITFSNRPRLVDMSSGKNLRDKLSIALQHNEIANTNIEAVFDLILSTALKNNMSQEDIPANILIISDMEFDSATCCNKSSYGGVDETLFKTIEDKYKNAGYKLPRLVFWNVNSRTNTIPVRENGLGVALVSGFSVNICKMVMSGKTDPYECLLETINSERYQPIEDALEV